MRVPGCSLERACSTFITLATWRDATDSAAVWLLCVRMVAGVMLVRVVSLFSEVTPWCPRRFPVPQVRMTFEAVDAEEVTGPEEGTIIFW